MSVLMQSGRMPLLRSLSLLALRQQLGFLRADLSDIPLSAFPNYFAVEAGGFAMGGRDAQMFKGACSPPNTKAHSVPVSGTLNSR